jgi:predicted AlkP superfamily pyrophosphatase or phosphodiesterase
MTTLRARSWSRARTAALATLVGLSAAAPAFAEPVGGPARGLTTDHVVVISIDGLRPDAIAKFRATTLQRLMSQGSYTLAAKTIMPSRTLPSHTSMLTGEEPEKHGITWNSNETDEHGLVTVPTVFAKAHQAGFRTAAFFSKGKFNHLEVPNSLDHAEAPQGDDKWTAERTVANVERYLARAQPNLLFVHIGEPDYAGHRFSWMSPFYANAVRKADRAVARVLAASERAYGAGNFTVIVTADHGGHGWDHGTSDPRDVTIPWIAWGQGVRRGAALGSAVRTMDTAVTALWLLGLDGLGVGRPVQTAFAPQLANR